MEDIDFEIRRKNASFLSNHFFGIQVRFNLPEYVSFNPDDIKDLKKSIEIVKSGQYSKRNFKKSILSVSAPEFWRDLYWLEYYETGKEAVEALLIKHQTEFDNDPDKDDIDYRNEFDEIKSFKQKNLKDVNVVIELTKEFRALINEAFPDLEKEFVRLLQEHNDLQLTIAATDEEQKRQRAERIANKTAIIQQQGNIEQLQQERIELKDLIQCQNSLIPKVTIKAVYEHFKILTEQTNKFNEFYLTEEQLFIFIKSTFIDKKPVKQNFKSFKKKDIRKLFYQFYFDNQKNEGNHTDIKKKYFSILNDAFDGFNKNDYTDFHKI